jgi:hypothetical protein
MELTRLIYFSTCSWRSRSLNIGKFLEAFQAAHPTLMSRYIKRVSGSYELTTMRKPFGSMIGENQQLLIDEPVEFEE